MSAPSDFARRFGDPITITRVVDYTIDSNGNPENVTREYIHTTGVISNPSMEDERVQEGHLDTGGIRVTLPEDIPVTDDERTGGRDRVLEGHVTPSTATDVDAYSVVRVVEDTHNIADITKLTVECNRFSGRSNVRDDADQYVQS